MDLIEVRPYFAAPNITAVYVNDIPVYCHLFKAACIRKAIELCAHNKHTRIKNMARFIVFVQRNHTVDTTTGEWKENDNPKVVDCVGTDSIIRPDQRFSNKSLIEHTRNLEFPIPNVACGFYIARGTDVNHLYQETKVYYFDE